MKRKQAIEIKESNKTAELKLKGNLLTPTTCFAGATS